MRPKKAADAFLKARMAVQSFYWTPSDTGVQMQKLFVCRSKSWYQRLQTCKYLR
jgi:phage-related protein